MKKSMYASVVMVAAVLFGACYMVQKSDTYYGVKTSKKNIVFLVDISGSMEGKNEGNYTDRLRAQAVNQAGDAVGSLFRGPVGGLVSGTVKGESTKLGSAKRELIPAIRGLAEDNNFTIITFESDVKKWREKLVEPTSTNKNLAQVHVKGLSSMGGTSALKGLRAAFAVKGVDMIFFLSDGYPSDGSADTIIAEVEKLNQGKKITIHCVGLGDDKDEKFMKKLAAENNGIYVER